MEPLTMRLLGTPQVTFGQRPLSFATRKTLAMLVYLAVEGGRPSRETLMALLWPESEPEKAAATFRGTLARLRRALQPAGEFVISQGGTVAFDFEQDHDLDLAWLAAAARAEMPAAELTPVLALDRGEFLEGFSLPDAPTFDTWAAIQRETIQRQLETVYDRLSQHQLAAHDGAAAVETAARWVARAPLSEQAYRRLMAAQALSGQRPVALQTYSRLRATLRQELDLEPSRETTVLAEQIGRGRGTGEGIEPMSVAGARGPTLRLVLPLVGRANEHGQMADAFRQVSREGAQALALIGAAGVGKTRLVSAFQEWAMLDSPDVDVWQGRAFETGGRLAYQPVVEAMRVRLEEENAPEDLLEDVWLAELSQLMPELRARYPDLPPPMTGDAHFVRARLFEALAVLGNALAARRPAIFVLDDMQWADADTLELIHYLARRWAETGAPILLLLTVRQESFAADAGLREWLSRLGRDVPLTRLLLDTLTGTAMQELVTSLASPAADEASTAAFGEWLWAETRGLPFFVEALLQMLVEQGTLAVSDEAGPAYDFAAALRHVQSVTHVPLPPGVREVILARMEGLPEAERAMLLAAAVLGRESSFERLCQVAEAPEVEALATVEALLNGRLLNERPAARRPYTLAHDYIREVVYRESHEARRRIFHRRALLALEADQAPAAECAFHALASLLDEPAFRFSLAAGDEALGAWAFEESLAHYERAREVAERMAGVVGAAVDPQSLRRLYQNRGRALELTEDYQAAQANYNEMLSVAAERQDQALELAALIAQCIIHARHNPVFNPQRAGEEGQVALDLARELNDRPAEARALWGLMVAGIYGGGSSQQTSDYGQRSLALARELGLTEQMGYVLVNLCWPYIAQKQLQAAFEANHEAQAIWQELGNQPMLLEVYEMRQWILAIAGDNPGLMVAAHETLRLSLLTGNQGFQGNALRFMGLVHLFRGRFEEALADFEAAKTLPFRRSFSEHANYDALLLLYHLAGALDQAEFWADKLYEALRERSFPVFEPYYLTNIARVKIARGKLAEGQAILDGLLETLAPDAPWSHTIITIAIVYGQLQLARGKPERVFDLMDERMEGYRQASFLHSLAEEFWVRGRAQLLLGQLEAARAALLEAKETAEAREERVMLWQILAALSELELACGDMAAAESYRDQARAVIDDIAAQAGELRADFLGQPAVVRLLGES
jgi:DNA-binding SARP family transcriptional activator/tetratricopeptide (TPR) repeat protein